MSPLVLTLSIFGIMLVLMAIRIPIAVSMFAAGALGYVMQTGWSPFANFLNTAAFARFASYDLSVIPLFILMGNFMAVGGLAEELFKAADAFVGHIRGGLAHATVVASAGFGGPCGSSIATAATMSKVAIPPMRRLGYHDRLSSGAVASAGVLGVLIPPSVPLVIFGLLTEDVARLRSQGYRPRDHYEANPELRQVLDQMAAGAFSPDQPDRFMPIVQGLLDHGDHYCLLADYAQYVAAQERVDALYADADAWTATAIRNVAAMGPFSSDRTIREYAEKIWHVTAVKQT